MAGERELKKKKWAKPKLIILTRGDRQERVLSVCKTQSGSPVASGTLWKGCEAGTGCFRCYDTFGVSS